MPSVSIIIPVYNQIRFVQRAIDSVLEQRRTSDVEVIVIDDGSTDGVGSILEKYGDKIIWESRLNRGQSASLNYGWSLAQSNILGYLSADDALLPGSIERSLELMISKPNSVMTYGDYLSVDENDRVIRRVRTDNFNFETMLLKIESPAGPGTLFRRGAFAKVGGWNEQLHRLPDFDFWLKMAALGDFTRVDAMLAMWRVHEGSQAFGSISSERAEEPNLVIKEFFERENPPKKLVDLRIQSVAAALIFSGQLHARSGRYKVAFKSFLKAVLIDPSKLVQARTFHILLNSLFQQKLHRILVWIRSVL